MNASLQRRAFSLCALVLALALGGCAAVAPGPQLPTLQVRHDGALPAAAGRTVTPDASGRPWWRDLRDPMLDALVAQAEGRNLDLQVALATVREARARAGVVQSEARPQGSLGVQAQAVRPALPEVDPYRQSLPRPPEQRLVSLGQGLNWEIDLFGRAGTAQAAAERDVDAAAADARGAQALVQAEVVNRYVALRHAQQATLLAAEQQGVAERRLAELRDRARAGLADPRESDAAAAELARQRAAHAGRAAQVSVEWAALAVLVGESPARPGAAMQALQVPAALPIVPDDATLTVPADLLARRPDVARADALLRAGLGQKVLAERAYLPRLSLAATLGLQQTAGNLGQANALRYAAGPMLQWDWLDSGRRAAQTAAVQAGNERAWAQFEKTVLAALAEGESALRAWQAQWQAWQQAQAALQAADETLRYTSRREAHGLEPAVAVLAARQHRLTAAQQRLEQQAQTLAAYTQVQLALAAWQPQVRP
ncbi:TolC family protein [Pelomonas aquatica]|jgi:NodT family efflux transporter outer membrane factor (OMF) lipoprotein|uniref:TolC family protein n=1 Tax=Pelomonas aquatica TaxID=431058 RepID=A0A9X4LKL0_9BURK|nr:TolC family protein [Pelomonas aquatica]MCY4757138.1 TolC family protein [Pelomonas aquatica]MDG0864574.1 TolC family protein [Pelomonas aquatica]